MRVYFYYIIDEFKSSISKIDLLIPNIISAVIPVFVLTYGFKNLGYYNYSKIISSGFLFSTLLGVSISAVILITIDLTIGNLFNIASYPLSILSIFIIKFSVNVFIALIIGIISFIIPNYLLYNIYDFRILLIFLTFLIQIVILTGFVLLISIPIKDITKIGLIVSISSTVLVYFSPVYFPINVFPNLIKPFIYINPITFPLLFLRTIIENKTNYNFFNIMLIEFIIYCILSIMILKTKINKLR